MISTRLSVNDEPFTHSHAHVGQVSQAELKVDINWANVHTDKQFGPKAVWTKEDAIDLKCTNSTAPLGE